MTRELVAKADGVRIYRTDKGYTVITTAGKESYSTQEDVVLRILCFQPTTINRLLESAKRLMEAWASR